MTCSSCGSKTTKITCFFVKNRLSWQCKYCPAHHIPQPLFSQDLIRVRGAFGGIGRRTARHDADISRRKLSPDGEVYRDYGRKVI